MLMWRRQVWERPVQHLKSGCRSSAAFASVRPAAGEKGSDAENSYIEPNKVLLGNIASNGQQFGQKLARAHRRAVIFGTDGLLSSAFTIAGS